ncbi:MAG: hemolysin family protein [Flavihumibacter sp.]|nr:hemolysin family protein [Flavihumibacter sp.]
MLITVNLIFIVVILSILLIGFFSGIEVAFVSVNRLTVELKRKQGKSGGILISRLLEQPSGFIGITLVGFNIFLVIYGLLVGETLKPLSPWLNKIINTLHVPAAAVYMVLLLLEILVAAIIIIVLAEFLPKAVWRAKNEWIVSSVVAAVIGFFYRIFNPVANMFVEIANWILKYGFNVRVNEKKDAFTRADLEHFFQQSREEDEESQELNTELFENALTLSSTKVRQCLVPRKEIIGIDSRATIDDLTSKLVETKLSKLVVFDNSIDHIIGYIHQLDLFKKPAAIKDILLPIPAVPESMSASDLINKFTKERKSIAWVVDEFGGTAGIVTMEDLLEEIFGEIQDEYDMDEFEEKQLSEDEYLFAGRLELDYLQEKYSLEFNDEAGAETLSGYIIEQYERIPRRKERIIINNYEFEVLNVSDTRIEMVKLKILK